MAQLNLIKTGSLHLHNHKMLKFEGDINKVESLLQGQVTSDITELANKNAQLSCILDHKGFIQADFILLRSNDVIYVVIENSLEVNFRNQLKEFIKFYEVEIHSCDLSLMGIISAANDDSYQNYIFYKNKQYKLSLRFDGSREIISDKKLTELDWKIANKALLNFLFSIEDINKYRPNEINYDKSRVSFTKGCYRGQEIVARVHHLGVNRREFVTVIAPINEKIDTKLKIHGEILELSNVKIFNTHFKRDDIENKSISKSLKLIRFQDPS